MVALVIILCVQKCSIDILTMKCTRNPCNETGILYFDKKYALLFSFHLHDDGCVDAYIYMPLVTTTSDIVLIMTLLSFKMLYEMCSLFL